MISESFKVYRRSSGWSTQWFLARQVKDGLYEYVLFRGDGYINLVQVKDKNLIKPFFVHDQFFNESMGQVVKPLIKAFNKQEEV